MTETQRLEVGVLQDAIPDAPPAGRMQQPSDTLRAGQTVSVVIPTRGASGRLERCLDALTRQTHRPIETVLVISGAHGTDGASGCWSKTARLSLSGPVSFCRAANRGIASTSGKWVLLLNDDVVLTPSFLERLLDGIPPEERIGMVSGKLLAAEGRTIDSTGQFLSRARTAAERGHGSIDHGQFDAPGYVFSAPGAAALYRRRMLESIAVGDQYFDEVLRMYLEDLDLGWRAQRAGWRAYYVPGAIGYHARGATAKTRRPRWAWLQRYYLPWLAPELQARYVVNRYKLIAKHDSLKSFLQDSPWILSYELKLWLYLICLEQKVLQCVWHQLRTSSLNT